MVGGKVQEDWYQECQKPGSPLKPRAGSDLTA